MTMTVGTQDEIIMDGMNAVEYFADMNRELAAMGLRPVASIEEARRPRGATLINIVEDPWARGNGNVASRSARDVRMASDAQINYIISLTEQITGIRDAIESVQREGFTKVDASAMIERLIPLAAEAKRQVRVAPIVAVKVVESVTDGMYMRDGVVYKVQIAKQGSGRLYAKRLTEHGFEYAPGAIRDLRPEHKMTLEQAKEYGRLYGTCCSCGRDLTDEESIANGIGPICAKKF